MQIWQSRRLRTLRSRAVNPRFLRVLVCFMGALAGLRGLLIHFSVSDPWTYDLVISAIQTAVAITASHWAATTYRSASPLARTFLTVPITFAGSTGFLILFWLALSLLGEKGHRLLFQFAYLYFLLILFSIPYACFAGAILNLSTDLSVRPKLETTLNKESYGVTDPRPEKKKHLAILVWIAILILCLIAFLPIVAPDDLIWRHEIYEGSELVWRIETFRSDKHRLPESLQELDIRTPDSLRAYYVKCNDTDYRVWFGTSLGESMTYDPARHKWESVSRPCAKYKEWGIGKLGRGTS